MNVDILIFAVIALVIAYRVYNVLGAVDKNNHPAKFADKANNSNVVNLEKDKYEVAKEEEQKIDEEEQRLIDHLDEASQEMLKKIQSQDESFSLKKFTQGAEKAFEIIIAAFVKGDKKTLASLTNKEMAEKFIAEFDNLQKLERKISINIVSIVRNIIDEIKINGKDVVSITVKLTSEQITVITDKDGNVISGKKDQVEEMDDVWTFERNLNEKSNMWLLSNTEN